MILAFNAVSCGIDRADRRHGHFSEAAISSGLLSDHSAKVTVQSSAGPIVGIRKVDHAAFLGIPFAQSTAGSNRWKAPVALSAWKDPRAAFNYGKSCLQLGKDLEVIGDEDCLNLNVWNPVRGNPKQALPVMVFVHGGANVRGASSAELGA
jgi:carboxylesterase type B